MDDPSLYIKWKTMWDAQEMTTQLFFLVNVIIGIVIAAQPFRGGKNGSGAKRAIVFGIGAAYLVIVVVAYLQLVPTFSPYEHTGG